jgi:hypothetical protein
MDDARVAVGMRRTMGVGKQARDPDRFSDAFSGLIGISQQPEHNRTIRCGTNTGIMSTVDVCVGFVALYVVEGGTLPRVIKCFCKVPHLHIGAPVGMVRLKQTTSIANLFGQGQGLSGE